MAYWSGLVARWATAPAMLRVAAAVAAHRFQIRVAPIAAPGSIRLIWAVVKMSAIDRNNACQHDVFQKSTSNPGRLRYAGRAREE